MTIPNVVVTGLGATTPVGGDVQSTWSALLAGTSGIKPLTEDWAEQLPVRIAGRVAVEPTDVLERVQARRMDRGSQMALIAGKEAWADAGGDAIGVDKERLGVVVASGIGGIITLLNTYVTLNTKG